MTINIPDNKVEYVIMDILTELGTPDHLIGYEYVSEAIKMAVHDRAYINQVTGLLYPKISAKFNTTTTRVERAIRHAIEVTWNRADIEVLYKHFGNTVHPLRGKPTNTEFIARVANIVKRRCME